MLDNNNNNNCNTVCKDTTASANERPAERRRFEWPGALVLSH